MKQLLITTAIIVLFSGCAMTSVNYNSDIKKENEYKQYIEHSECKYLVGPFNTSDDLVVEDVIKNTIEKGNEQGMYGNTLVNVDIQEGGFSGIIFNELCLYVKGNIIYTEDL
jgi:hypothetical protein